MQRLLVVDDRPEICDVIEAYLSNEGYTVTVASHGDAARAELESGRFEGLIVDVVLPGMSGLALAELATAKNIPVVLISGEPKTIRSLDGGARAFLQKPFHLSALAKTVRALFEAHPTA